METVKIKQLCYTGTTLYAVDDEGYVWYLNLKDGKWSPHGNPTFAQRENMPTWPGSV